MHISNKKIDILVFGDGITQGLNDTTIKAEAKYYIGFARSGRKFCLSLLYNGNNSFLFVSATKMYQLKAQNSEIKPCTCMIFLLIIILLIVVILLIFTNI